MIKLIVYLLCDAEMEEKAIVDRSIDINVNRAIVVILVPSIYYDGDKNQANSSVDAYERYKLSHTSFTKPANSWIKPTGGFMDGPSD